MLLLNALNRGGGLALECSLQLSEGHGQVRTLREELSPFRNVGLQKSLILLMREDALLGLLDKIQDVLFQGIIHFGRTLFVPEAHTVHMPKQVLPLLTAHRLLPQQVQDRGPH
uniref:Uncharacterized protein n=1 Tax=Lepeophtheirus salmonis TaxID=72036 RepID=A0A0K2UD48_LEPSM